MERNEKNIKKHSNKNKIHQLERDGYVANFTKDLYSADPAEDIDPLLIHDYTFKRGADRDEPLPLRLDEEVGKGNLKELRDDRENPRSDHAEARLSNRDLQNLLGEIRDNYKKSDDALRRISQVTFPGYAPKTNARPNGSSRKSSSKIQEELEDIRTMLEEIAYAKHVPKPDNERSEYPKQSKRLDQRNRILDRIVEDDDFVCQTIIIQTLREYPPDFGDETQYVATEEHLFQPEERRDRSRHAKRDPDENYNFVSTYLDESPRRRPYMKMKPKSVFAEDEPGSPSERYPIIEEPEDPGASSDTEKLMRGAKGKTVLPSQPRERKRDLPTPILKNIKKGLKPEFEDSLSDDDSDEELREQTAIIGSWDSGRGFSLTEQAVLPPQPPETKRDIPTSILQNINKGLKPEFENSLSDDDSDEELQEQTAIVGSWDSGRGFSLTEQPNLKEVKSKEWSDYLAPEPNSSRVNAEEANLHQHILAPVVGAPPAEEDL